MLAPLKGSNTPEDEGKDEGLTAQYTSLIPDRDPATYWPQEFDTTPFDIISTSDKSNDFKLSFVHIQSELMEPLEPKDQEEGYLYAYEVEGNASFVKIGFTRYSIEKRHDEWATSCNRKPKSLYPIPPNPRVVFQMLLEWRLYVTQN